MHFSIRKKRDPRIVKYTEKAFSSTGLGRRAVVQRQYLPLGWVRPGFNSRQPDKRVFYQLNIEIDYIFPTKEDLWRY